jgi:hypothetical protein
MAIVSFLSEDDWRDLLREIHNRQVIPFVGPELVTVPDPNGNEQLPLHRALAPQLATRLKVPVRDGKSISLNRVACEYLLSGGSRKSIYIEMSELLETLGASPPRGLCDLASITDFDLYLYGAIDSLLPMALEQSRPGFRRQDHVLSYDYKRPVDVPERIDPALLGAAAQSATMITLMRESAVSFKPSAARPHAAASPARTVTANPASAMLTPGSQASESMAAG